MKYISLLILNLTLLTGCLNQVEVSLKLKSSGTTSTSTDTLVWNYSNLVILPGEIVPFNITNGTPNYVTNPNGIGTFNNSTLEYVAPKNQAATNHSIYITDSLSKTGTNNLKISAFTIDNQIKFPQSFGDQNFITSFTQTANNNMYISSIISDSPGWERWVIFKSSDNGSNWSKVDQYVPYEDGESHPLSLASKNNDIYSCGYVWGSSVYGSEWVVRKSTDNGVTWNNVDLYRPHINTDHVCYSMAIDSTSGNLFTAGYDNDGTQNRGIIRESVDDGQTWTTINTLNGRLFFSINISPMGNLWAIADDGKLYIGTYSLGSWSFTAQGTLTAGSGFYGLYEMKDSMVIISESIAYVSYVVSSKWAIDKTTDGGATWTRVFTDTASTTGYKIDLDINGYIIAIGKSNTTPTQTKIIRSTDAGSTWNTIYTSSGSVNQEGHLITLTNNNDLLAFGNYNTGSYQITVAKSTDNGSTWNSLHDIIYTEQLYTEFNDFLVDSLGNFFATGWSEAIDSNLTNPWVVMKSTNQGSTWSYSDVFTDTTINYNALKLAKGPNDEIYTCGTNLSQSLVVRKSSDHGATWGQVDFFNPGASYSSYVCSISTQSNGNVYVAFQGSNAGVKYTFIRRGTSNGTSWSTVATFPIAAGSTNFQVDEIKVLPNNLIVLYGSEKNSSNVSQQVAYTSNDNGVTFTEIFRAAVASSANIVFDNNNDFYISLGKNIYKFINNGASYSTFYTDTSTAPYIKKLFIDSSNKFYYQNSLDQILTQNQFDNSWFITFDYPAYTSISGHELHDLINCMPLAKVCAITGYAHSVTGNTFFLFPLKTP